MVSNTRSCDLFVDDLLRTGLKGNQCFINKESSEISDEAIGGGMYKIYYTENDAPDEPRIGMVSAPNLAVACRVAEMQFVNSTITKVIEMTPPEEETRFPGARFIRGEFRPVAYADEMMQ